MLWLSRMKLLCYEQFVCTSLLLWNVRQKNQVHTQSEQFRVYQYLYYHIQNNPRTVKKKFEAL